MAEQTAAPATPEQVAAFLGCPLDSALRALAEQHERQRDSNLEEVKRWIDSAAKQQTHEKKTGYLNLAHDGMAAAARNHAEAGRFWSMFLDGGGTTGEED